MNPVIATILLVFGLFVFVFAIIFLAIFSRYFWLWIQSISTRANVSVVDLLGMMFRRVDAKTIVRGKIMAVQAGIRDEDLTTKALEAHYLARGNVPQVIRALVAARKSKQITLSFREAAAIDLAGRNVLDAVQTSVYPKVIDCPPKGSAVAFLEVFQSVRKDMQWLQCRLESGTVSEKMVDVENDVIATLEDMIEALTKDR